MSNQSVGMRRRRAAAPVPEPVPAARTLADAIDDMPPEHLLCRDLGHSWAPWRAVLHATGRHYEVSLRCRRCRTVRVRWIGLSGQIIASHYEYADGYTLTGFGRMESDDRDHVRLANVLKLLPQEGAANA